MAEWKKVVVSGSNISELNNDAGFLASIGSGIVSGSSQISFTGITNVPAGLVSGSSQITMGGDLSGTANSATVTAVQNVALTSGEATQLANIDSTTISSTQWGYLGVMDQAVQTNDSVEFGGLTVNGTVRFNNGDLEERFQFNGDTGLTTLATASVSQNLTVGGNLYVNGDLTNVNTTNLNVEDKFILLGSGSASPADVGIIFGGVTSPTRGAAFFYDADTERLAYAAGGVDTADTDVTPSGYVPVAYDVTGESHTPENKVGNIKIESGEAYIYV